ncbi:MAG: hypothetical protein JW991_02650 [Candidatus Pacebacteria bacterium]|nr:hypothetical protein [Candidatus Paceibacterota bacterium]
MRKEVVVAIALGFILGLVITFSIWTANKAIQEKPAPTPSESLPSPIEATPTPISPASLLQVLAPENYFISDQEKIKITGSTEPGTTVVVLFEEGESILEADETGDFEITIDLIGGANRITIKAFSPDGREDEKTLNLIYSTAEI